MKILSALGMLFSTIQMMALTLLYFAGKVAHGKLETTLIIMGLIIGLFFLVFSFLIAKRYNWGDKNSFSPMTGY